MMKYLHNIKISVFSKEDEDKNKILEGFLALFPFDVKENKVNVDVTRAESFSDRIIEIIEVKLEKQSLVNSFVSNLISKIKDIDKSTIISQIESRLDEGLHFFLRIDKDSWMNDHEIMITDSGNCFHIRMSVAAFPKKREIALKLMKELFSKQ